jgi:imidazolonepropionase-like amidohydrolase
MLYIQSDHPVLNSRYLLHEAQKAHYYGLSQELALASVTTTPATVLGQDHRIGFIKKGYDAGKASSSTTVISFIKLNSRRCCRLG